MALEQRNGRVYYYTSRRVGERVIRQYAGAGKIAELAAQLDIARRQERNFEALDRKSVSDDLRGENAAFREWFSAVEGLVTAALEVAGWHRVRRQWRKQRGATVSTLATVEQLPWVSAELVARAGQIDPTTVDKATKGDRAALKEVDNYLDHPAARALWGDLGRLVLKKWVDLATGKNEVTRRAMLRFAADLRAKLAGPDPSTLDTLLAERVVLAWLFVHWAEYQYAGLVTDLSLKAGEFHLKRIEMAHRNLLSACRMLAKVKRAKLPDVLALVNVSPPPA